MKISKKRLQQIIKEERARLLTETIADHIELDTMLDEMANEITSWFGGKMELLHTELRMGAEGVRKNDWMDMVHNAQLQLDVNLGAQMKAVVARAIEGEEIALKSGEYSRARQADMYGGVDTSPSQVSMRPTGDPGMAMGLIKTSSFE